MTTSQADLRALQAIYPSAKEMRSSDHSYI